MQTRRFSSLSLLPPLLLLLLPTLLLWRVVFAGDVFLPADLLRDVYPWRGSDPNHLLPWNPLMWDGMAEFYPWRLFAAQSLRAGWLPLWNPHQLCGTPFVANSQSAVFYPPNLLFCLLPVARAFGVSVWLHLALTGLLMYGYLRSPAWALSGPAALLGAVAWQMSAWQVSWLALPTFLGVSCWLPLALWLTWRAIAPDRPPAPNSGATAPKGGVGGEGAGGRWAALGVCLGVMILAGHLQIALYCLGLTCTYGLFLFFSASPIIGGRGASASPIIGGRGASASPIIGGRGASASPIIGGRGASASPIIGGRGASASPIIGGRGASASPIIGGRGVIRRAALGALLALALMAGLAAPQLLPAIELARVSHRAGAPVTLHSYQSYTALALPALNLVTLWLPGLYGSPTEGTYWGVLTNGGPSAYIENACSVGVLALALAFLGVAATWRQNWGTRFFAVLAGVALLMALGTPLDALPYFGLPGFAQSGSPGRVLVIWTFCAAVLAAVGAEQLVTGAVRWNRTTQGATVTFVGAFVIALGGALLWIARYGVAGALAFNLPRVGDLWRVPVGILLGAAALLWFARRGTLSAQGMGLLLAALAGVELLAGNWGYNRTAPPGRVYPVTAGIAYLQQHLGTDRVLFLNGGWSIEGDRPPDAMLPPNGATVYGLNDIAGYDSLLTRRSFQFVAALDGGRGPAPQENGNLVFTRDYRTPQAGDADARYVVSRTPLADPALTPAAQDAGMSVYTNSKALPRARVVDGVGAAALTDTAPTRVSVQATGAGALVVADQWYPGWQASVNGKPAGMDLEGGMFRRVPLPAAGGASQVEMRYLPAAFRVGLYGFLLALGAAVGATAAGGLGRRRGR